MSLERRLASDVLEEIVENFKWCTIQSDELVDKIIYSEEHVDMRNWLRKYSAEQVDALSDAKKSVVDGSNPKSDPRVDTHTTNIISANHTTERIPTQTLLINPTIQFFAWPITPLVTAGVVGEQESLSLRQTVLPQAIVTDAAPSCARIYRTHGKVSGTERDGAMPIDASSSETKFRFSLQSLDFIVTFV